MIITRSNDRLSAVPEGPAFTAHSGAKHPEGLIHLTANNRISATRHGERD
jgi:hypothetical protein